MGNTDLTYIDLFAGAGGLSVGLERAGFDLCHAIEIDADARATFVNNRKELRSEDLTQDIRDVNKNNITDIVGCDTVDLVAGGPPCQGFSEVVSPDGSDDRNHLFTYFMSWVEELTPRAALFENVRGMQNTADGKFLDAVKESFDQMGYDVSYRVVKASEFGVPQQRHRLIVIATQKGQTKLPFEGFELNPVQVPGVMDGIGDLPRVNAGEKATEYDTETKTVIQEDLRNNTQSLTHHQAANHTEEMVEMISHIPDGGNRTAIPDELQPSSGYHNSYSRLDSEEPAVAITSNMSKPSSARCIHPFQNRGLTPREGARLQTFPDSYKFEGGLVSVRRQIGNAVPPYLAETVGYYLKESVFHRSLTEDEQNRIYSLRCGGMNLQKFEERKSDIGGHARQATLDFAE